MAAGANGDFLSLQLERVRPFLPVAYEREKGFGAKIKKVEGIEVSSRNLRLPIQVSPGGKFGYCTFAGTSLGLGGASSTQVATLTPVGIRFNVQINRDVQYYTNSAEKASAWSRSPPASGAENFATIAPRPKWPGVDGSC